jgi:hypothetical protein
MAAADGFQDAAEENVTTHHYANVLFNVLRGGIFNDQYAVSLQDFANSVRHFNRDVYERNEALLRNLPAELDFPSLLDAIADCGDPQLERLCYEYLPITFGRRHGDPSRPWNHFSIKLKDDEGNRRLFYEGNWRDIFQNWEALAYSYPEFIENVIAKFVNASTIDGYNPYRITKSFIRRASGPCSGNPFSAMPTCPTASNPSTPCSRIQRAQSYTTMTSPYASKSGWSELAPTASW